jgi:hypothetical protein
MKQCAVCNTEFQQFQTTQRVCSPVCALELVKTKAAKKRATETRAMRKAFNEKDRGYQLKQAQAIFNSFIRARDVGQGCISCGIKTGKFDAGHFISVGHGGNSTRFEEMNCHSQCVQCNSYKSGNVALYRVNLIKKIGLKNVEQLESTESPAKLSIDDIIEIKLKYKAKLKALQ